jgi:small conductance mechanosensitive channel
MADSFSRWAEAALAGGLRLLGILVGAIVLIWLLRMLTRRLVHLATTESRAALLHEQQTRTLAGILYSAGTAIILAIAVLLALPEFGINVTPIAAAAGLASLAVGFGAQHLVRDLINGFFIVFEDQYVVGEMIRVGEMTGRVEHLTLRRTVMRDARGALVTIPNGEIRQVANISRDWSQVFVDATLAPDADVNLALEAIERTAAEMRADSAWATVLVDGPRVLGVESLGPGGTVVRVLARTAPTRQEDVAREFRRRVKVQLDRESIECTSTQRVELVGSQSS